MALPDIPRGTFRTVAIILCENAVLLLRHLGHRGIWYSLPGGRGKIAAAACAAGAVEELQAAARELAGQLDSNLDEQRLAIEITDDLGSYDWEDSNCDFHYFLAKGNGESILSGPRYRPPVDPATRFGVWMPFEWVPLAALSNTNLQPPEAVDICLRAASGAAVRPICR